MNILELTLQRKTDSGYPVIAALTRAGGFLPLRREGTLTLDIEKLAELQFEPLAYGTAIGQALFVDEIRDIFVKALGDEPLRVLLSIEAPDLRAIDWHRLAAPFDGRWRCLASQQNTPFSLSIPSPASVHFPALGRRDLRALVLVAGPEALSGNYQLTSFDVAATTASIQTALGDIPCDILEHPSLDALCAALTETPYTLLHLVCHGAVNQSGETILYFPKDSKGGPTPATDLLDRLSSLARLPHFAFISACESALPQNGLGSLAGRLVRELGLPAVLAMTDRVSIATAGAIAQPFYTQLYQHGQPDLALAQSLAGLQGAYDLTIPAIFSRLGDRPLFDDNTERDLTDKELEFGLAKLAESLPERAPVMDSLRDALTRRLRSTLGVDSKSLSESSRAERKETLDQLNSLSLEALDLSFNTLCLGQTPPAYDSRSPFRGLESFRPEDAAYFFGREALTKKLVQKLNDHNFLAVLGASGSGKSSLVMAGLIPALNVPYATPALHRTQCGASVFRPGAEPLAELEKALQAGPALLVVDQFEELFTLSAREQRAGFISRLLEQSQRLRVVITLRADFLGEVAPFKSLKDEVQNHQEIIPPMDEAELRRAMEGQAGCAGLRFESDLSQQMLDDVSGEPGAMPLLQHALWTLWTRRHGRWLRAEEYRAFGGVKQAIASTAETVYARCTELERERLRDIFLRLTRLDESADGRDTRRRVLLRDLIPADSDPAATTLLIKQLADARLVVVTGDEVEVAHEALIRHWERLRAWLNDDRDNLRLREGVSDDARRWDNANREETLLNHRGPRLELALAMSKNPHYRLNPVEQAYLDGCVALRKREIKTRETLRRRIIMGLATGLVIALVLAGFAVYQMSQAQRQTQIALARQLAAQAQVLFAGGNSKQMTAVQLAIQSMRMLPTSEAAQILQNNTLAQPTARMAHGDVVNAVAFSQNGKYIVSGSGDNTVRVWESATGKEIAYMIHGSWVNSVAFSPDGKYVVSGSADHTLSVWDATTGKGISLMTHDNYVESVAFSPDGKYVVSGSLDNSLRVWEANTGKEIVRMIHDNAVNSVTFSPDGKYVVSASWDKTARVWDATTGKEIARMTHNDDVWAVAFSPDGKYIVSGSDDNTARVWDVATGKEIARMTHDGFVRSVAFSPDGKYIISGSSDNTTRVWDVATGKEIGRFVQDGFVNSVGFSPDGKYVVSGSSDNTARVWDILTGHEIARMTHDNSVSFVAFSPNGKYVVSGSYDNTVRVWAIESGQGVARTTIHPLIYAVALSQDKRFVVLGTQNGDVRVVDVIVGNEVALVTNLSLVNSVAFSPDGKYVVSGHADSTARVWNVSTGRQIAQMTHGNFVNAVALSPDGKHVVSGDGNSVIRIWETTTGKETAQMTNDDFVRSFIFSPDGKYIVSLSDSKTANLWDATTGREITHMAHDDSVGTAAFSPDGKYFVSGSADKTARVWQTATGKEIARMTHDDSVCAIAFSPDGKYVVSGSADKTARVWQAATGREIARMPHDDSVCAIAFSPDGKYVISGSSDNSTRVWEVATGKEIGRMNNNSFVSLVAFSQDGKYAISVSGDGTVRYWLYQLNDLITDACSRITRNLTQAEWKQYIGDALPYQAVCPNLPAELEPTATPAR
jgi:uncharacterized delta-60 repeat protein